MFTALFFLFAGALLFAALLTPPIHSLIQIFWPEMSWPFSRVYDRVAMVSVVILIYMLRRSFDLSMVLIYFSRSKIGLKAQRLIIGSVIAGCSVMVLLPFFTASGVLVWSQESLGYFVHKALFKVLPVALLVSVLEESFFRVLIFASLKRKISMVMAAVCSSAIYAVVHFIAPVKSFVYADFSPWAGFIYLGSVFSRFLEGSLYPAVFGLFMVGLVLCYIMQRTNSLFLCIGLHAGWAGGLKMAKHIAVIPPATLVDMQLGSRYFLLAQYEAWLSITAVFCVLLICIEVLKMFGEREWQDKKV